MKILLSHGYFLDEDAKEQKIMRPYPPLGILFISAYLEKHDIKHDVYDTTFSSRRDFYDHLLHTRPNVVALYTNLMTKVNILQIIKFIRENFDCTIILGGPDTRYNAENYLRSGADYLVVGEGEQTMLDLVNYFQEAGNDRKKIQGLAFLENNTLIVTPEREKLKDLDSLPIPNRKKIDLQPYLKTWQERHGKNAMSISTMRGCPYTCKWCSRGVYGLSYRRRSPEKVVDELIEIRDKYNPDSLWFVDDVFTISHKWLEAFQDELQRRNVKISYECITRADRMNETVIRQLKETGCFRVWIGAESGSQKIIDLMDRRVDVQQVRDMINLSKKYGIETGTFIMLGYPGETEADIEETIHHLKESNPDHFTITVAYPIKGTELYEEVEGDLLGNPEWTNSTDREIDFRRAYSRKYYQYALMRVISEVSYYKLNNRSFGYSATKLKLKALGAKLGMRWQRLITR